jgi:hypothetical protein
MHLLKPDTFQTGHDRCRQEQNWLPCGEEEEEEEERKLLRGITPGDALVHAQGRHSQIARLGAALFFIVVVVVVTVVGRGRSRWLAPGRRRPGRLGRLDWRYAGGRGRRTGRGGPGIGQSYLRASLETISLDLDPSLHWKHLYEGRKSPLRSTYLAERLNVLEVGLGGLELGAVGPEGFELGGAGGEAVGTGGSEGLDTVGTGGSEGLDTVGTGGSEGLDTVGTGGSEGFEMVGTGGREKLAVGTGRERLAVGRGDFGSSSWGRGLPAAMLVSSIRLCCTDQ